jgi:hypothetical protein
MIETSFLKLKLVINQRNGQQPLIKSRFAFSFYLSFLKIISGWQAWIEDDPYLQKSRKVHFLTDLNYFDFKQIVNDKNTNTYKSYLKEVPWN